MEEAVTISCPFCGENFVTFIDLSAGDQSYTEDCQVCCQPIFMRIQVENGELLRVDCERES